MRVVRTLTTGLAVPWGVAFLPDGRGVVTERDSGRVLVVDAKSGKAIPIGTIEMTAPNVEAGLLGVAVSPTFTDDHLLYFYVSTPEDNRIVRATWDGGLVAEPQTILDGIPLGPIHDGGRLAFGPDGYLYASTGETGNRDLSQDKSSLAGKILRITPEGKPAPGDPFGNSPIYSYGHRNVQGLAWDDAGHLWASEFGDSTFDELNLIEPGNDYGWPLFEGRGDDPRYTDPKVVWNTDDASPSGLAYTDGHLWLAALRGQRLWRIDVDGTSASNPTDYFVGNYGRLRTVVVAPDGKLWVTTSNKDGRGVPSKDDDRILVVNPGAPR